MALGIGSALVALALVLGFVFVLAPHFGQPQPAAGAGAATTRQTIPAGWRLYSDPDGYFTIAVPPGWQVARDIGTGQEGNATSSAKDRTVTTTLLPPATTAAGTQPDKAAVGLRVSIAFDVYTNLSGNYKQTALCSAYQSADTQLNSYRAQQINPDRGWLVATSAAIYQVNYSLPGDLPGTMITTLPTPVPQATRTAADNQALAIIHTFRLTPATSPTC